MKIRAFTITDDLDYIIWQFMCHIKRDKKTKCWDWQGYIYKGYGYFYVSGQAVSLAHRVAYALFIGDIKAGHVIDHKCENTNCVNPFHVQMTTQSENVKFTYHNKRRFT